MHWRRLARARGNFRPVASHSVGVEQPESVVQPPPIPSFPAQALSFLSMRQMAPDLLRHPVFDEAEARLGRSKRSSILPGRLRPMERRPSSSPTMFPETAAAHERSASTSSSAKRGRSRQNGRRDAIRSQNYHSAANSRGSGSCGLLVYPHIGYLLAVLSSAVNPPLQAAILAPARDLRQLLRREGPADPSDDPLFLFRPRDFSWVWPGLSWAELGKSIRFVTCFLSKEPQLELIRRDQGFETGLDHPGLHASVAFPG
jgi:hypothetical protein